MERKHNMKPMLALLVIVLSLSLAACADDEINDLAKQHTGPYNIGNDVQFGGSLGLGGDNVFAMGILQVPVPSNLVRLSSYVSSLAGATQIRMGLYRDNAGTPANRVVGTPPKPIAVGLNSFNVPPTPLPAGGYWIAILVNGSINIRADVGGTQGPTKFFSHTFGDPWPSTFLPHSTLNNDPINLYMTVYP